MQIFSLGAFLTLFGLIWRPSWPLHESSSGYDFKNKPRSRPEAGADLDFLQF